MIPVNIPWRLIGAGTGLVAIVALVWMLRHSAYEAGFAAGKADSQAFYQPIVEAVERKAYEAEGRAKALATATQAVNAELERQHVRFKTTLAERERAARERLSHGMRVAAARCDGGSVPEASGPAAPPHGTAEELERDRAAGDRLIGDLVTIGSGCEQDAATVSAWQQFYRQQQAMRNSP